MVKPYLLTIELITEFYGMEKSTAYDLINKVRKSITDNKNYKPNVHDLCDYEGWDFNQFMFFLIATNDQAVALFGSRRESGKSTIVLDGKYGANTVLTVDHPPATDTEETIFTADEELIVTVEMPLKNLTVTLDGELDTPEKVIVIKKATKKKGIQ